LILFSAQTGNNHSGPSIATVGLLVTVDALDVISFELWDTIDALEFSSEQFFGAVDALVVAYEELCVEAVVAWIINNISGVE
jgi:hypothetical protein